MSVIARATYETLLAELQCRRDELDTTIRVVERLIAEGSSLAAATVEVVKPAQLPAATDGVTFVYDGGDAKKHQVSRRGGMSGVLDELGVQILRRLAAAGPDGIEGRGLDQGLIFAVGLTPDQRRAQRHNAVHKLKRFDLVCRDGAAWLLTSRGRERISEGAPI